MVECPADAHLGPAEAALLTLATRVTETPWALGSDAHASARAAGLSDGAVLHAVVLSAYFNYLNRVADAIDLDFDYASPLPRPDKDPHREPVARPSAETWPQAPALPLRMTDRLVTAEPYARWREYVLARDAPLSRRDRSVLVRAVAESLCDARTVAQHGSSSPRTPREELLAAYAVRLTVTPWRLDEASLRGLQGLGLDDRGLLDVISVAAFQNTASRLALTLGD